MIGVEWVRMMARYNAWQNEQVMSCVRHLPPDELTKDRGAFFGSILATLNHMVWADTSWMSRFDGGPGPDVPVEENTRCCLTIGAWEAARFQLDGRIKVWAAGLRELDLVGDLTWHSPTYNADYRKPMAICVTQLFNHQTHHRGQVHAMLTSIGLDPGITDLPFLPGS
ncbi:damage-inducible protein DinB [Oceanicola sp. D3]|uniref:DinB family protein n=1 Tax=Oceanicola sp. D3 TaxID=2587163 RepID=UPI0011212576|nr:DinB family protein [Oceanicola sp. D3]QDC09623.1 damage-inducible protein DinB [Oceanicola sp. D3]